LTTWGPPSDMPVQALFFDVFGTLVDFRTGVAREAERILKPLGFAFDWLAFADAWPAEYHPAMDEIRAGPAPCCNLGALHGSNLRRILAWFGVSELPGTVIDDLNLAWLGLDAWRDVGLALSRLRARFLIAPVSNGNISLMVALARRNGFS